MSNKRKNTTKLYYLLAAIVLALLLTSAGAVVWPHTAVYWLCTGLAVAAMVAWVIGKKLSFGLRQIDAALAQALKADKAYTIASKAPEKSFFAPQLASIETITHKLCEATRLISTLDQQEQPVFDYIDTGEPLATSIASLHHRIQTFNREESERKWIVEGVAKFAGLLRNRYDSEKTYFSTIISELVKYLGCNQGGIYIEDTDEEGARFLELKAAYAYKRHKHIEQRIYEGKGLLGQCMQEKDIICLTDIPKEYIRITSGLGHAPPANVVIVPLIANDIFYGAVELASFSVLEAQKITLLKELTSAIGASVSVKKNTYRTDRLLQESRELTQELRNSEEEMKQNMEELSATQEEMLRKQAEIDGIMLSVNSIMALAEIDMEGRVIKTNAKMDAIFGLKSEELYGKSNTTILGRDLTAGGHWAKIRKGEQVRVEHSFEAKGKRHYMESLLSAVYSPGGAIMKVLMLSREITERVNREKAFETLSLVVDNTDNSVIITDKNGQIEYVNSGFKRITGYDLGEVKGKKPGSILQGSDTDPATVIRIRKALAAHQPFYDEILNYDKKGNSYWISLMINPIFDKHGRLEKYISIQADITKTKENALDLSSKMVAISKSNAVIEFDTDGHIISANENFLNIVNYSQAEVVGKHHALFVSEAERHSPAYKNFWTDLATGKFVEGEFERVGKDGKKIYLRGIYNPIFGLSNKPVKIMKFATDITQEKYLEKKAKDHEAKITAYLEAINKTVASCEFSADGAVTGANEIFLGITGYKLEEIIGQHHIDLLPASEKEKPQTQLMWDNLRQAKSFSGEFIFCDAKGQELWLDGTFNPMVDRKGQVYKVVMLAIFSTDNKNKFNELNGVLQAMKNTLAYFELYPDGTFKAGSHLFFDHFNYSRKQLRGLSFKDFATDLSDEVFEEMLDQLKKAECVQNNVKVDRGDGMSRYCITLTPIHNLAGKFTKVVGIPIPLES